MGHQPDKTLIVSLTTFGAANCQVVANCKEAKFGRFGKSLPVNELAFTPNPTNMLFLGVTTDLRSTSSY